MQISRKVLRVLQAEKISADELYQMLDEVAFTSIRGCNRRYFQWLFKIDGNMLQDMQRLDLVEIGRGGTACWRSTSRATVKAAERVAGSVRCREPIEDTTAAAMHAAR